MCWYGLVPLPSRRKHHTSLQQIPCPLIPHNHLVVRQKDPLRHCYQFFTGEGGLRPQCAKEVDGMARAVVSTNKGKFLTRSASYGRITPTLQHKKRFLAGGIRCAGRGLLNFRKKVEDVLDVMLPHGDKGVRKSGCKLLRHVLSCLVECYPTDWWMANGGVLKYFQCRHSH